MAMMLAWQTRRCLWLEANSTLLSILIVVIISLILIGVIAIAIKMAALLFSKVFRVKNKGRTSIVKRIVIVCTIAIVYYVAFFTCKFIVFENLTLSPAHYQISENCIIVHGQAVTGPEIRVVEGAEFLLASIPMPHPEDLNVSEIEMTGKTIFSGILDYPDYYACNWLIYGKLVGITDQYAICGDGTIPVFETEKVYPMMPLSDFFGLEIIMYTKFPWGLLMAGLLYLWPVAAILALFIRREKTI